jgi:hypothetical protein
MGLLTFEDLRDQILPDRLLEEAVTCPPHDGDEPWQHKQQHPDHANQRAQAQQPVRRAVGDHEKQRGKPDHHQDQRPLQQDTACHRAP